MSQILQTRVAFLESQVDHLETELMNLNDLLIQCGFPEGIKTLKFTVEEILSSGALLSEDDADFI